MRAQRSARLALGALLLLGASARVAAAEDTVTIGVYTPSAPFNGPVARLEYANKLAAQIGPALGRKGVGKAFARAADLSAAIKRGELEYAVLDGPYLAALGVPYKVLGAAQRGGASEVAWEVVTTLPAKTLADLAGKTVVLPEVGGKSDDFVMRVLMEGELPANHFGKIIQAPDALSALAALGHGRAEVALVPASLPLPAGARRLLTLGLVPWPALVALPSARPEDLDKVASAGAKAGGEVLSGFDRGNADAYRSLARRFGRATRRGPLAVPPQRLAVGDLLVQRNFTIVRSEISALLPDPAAGD